MPIPIIGGGLDKVIRRKLLGRRNVVAGLPSLVGQWPVLPECENWEIGHRKSKVKGSRRVEGGGALYTVYSIGIVCHTESNNNIPGWDLFCPDSVFCQRLLISSISLQSIYEGFKAGWSMEKKSLEHLN